MTRPYLIASCANDDGILNDNLLASPDIREGTLPVQLIRGARSAAAAYADILNDRPARFVIFVHQDVYLPAGFKRRLDDVVRQFDDMHPTWAVAGVYGAAQDGTHAGLIYDGSNARVLGTPVQTPSCVAVLDEVVIIVRADSGVTFDRDLPGFHLYGTQIALDARRKGRTVLVGDLPVVHNSRSILKLGRDYEAAWHHLAAVWGQWLPVPNLCCGRTTASRWPLWRWRARNRMRLVLGRRRLTERSANGQTLAQAAGFE